MNWGNKLLITFLVFGGGMGFLVYKSMSTNFELVEKDYYKTELRHQQTIDAANHYRKLGRPIVIEQSAGGTLLRFPREEGKQISGQVWFYCAYDAARDKKISLSLDDEASQFLPAGVLAPGHYTARINWTSGETTYYTEKQISITE